MEATPSMIKFCHTALILNDKNVQLMSPFGILRKREREEMEKEGGKERAPIQIDASSLCLQVRLVSSVVRGRICLHQDGILVQGPKLLNTAHVQSLIQEEL